MCCRLCDKISISAVLSLSVLDYNGEIWTSSPNVFLHDEEIDAKFSVHKGNTFIRPASHCKCWRIFIWEQQTMNSRFFFSSSCIFAWALISTSLSCSSRVWTLKAFWNMTLCHESGGENITGQRGLTPDQWMRLWSSEHETSSWRLRVWSLWVNIRTLSCLITYQPRR